MQYMKKFKRPLIWATAVLTSVVLAGCGGNNGGNQEPAAPDTQPDKSAVGEAITKVTIGYTPTIVLPQPLVGLENGEYKKELPGVACTGKVYEAGSGVIEALRAGNIDIGSSGPYPALKAFAKSGDIVLLAGAATGGTELMVAKDSPIKSVKDLKGKAIGVNQLGSTVDSMVRYNLLKAGLNPDKDAKIIEVKPGEQAEALKGGDIAAVAAPAPWPSQVAAKGNGRTLLDWKNILDNGEYSAGSIYTTKQFADAHPEFIKQFLAAHQAITDRLNKDRAKGDASVLSAWSKVTTKTLDPAVAKAAFATIKYTTDPDPEHLQSFADIAFEVGALKKKADLTSFVYSSK
jgi:NitT/TauT family transport system substrate-binding protein